MLCLHCGTPYHRRCSIHLCRHCVRSSCRCFFHPMSGGLARTYGRRPALLLTIGLFALGCGICGAAISMNMLIAGRTLQGLGGGGIQSLTTTILADLVTLQERSLYVGLYGFTSCIAAAIGQGQWHWLFYLNLPISLVAGGSAIFFLDLHIPPGSSHEKFTRMDWIRLYNWFDVGRYHGAMGLSHPAPVLVPLVIGFVGLVVFIACHSPC
ncbi:MFS general substrate transporter [Imleria badia]|nr:MFS general substrate transporter [Imleria badia]